MPLPKDTDPTKTQGMPGQSTRKPGQGRRTMKDVARAAAKAKKGGQEPSDEEVAVAGQQIMSQAAPDFLGQAEEASQEDFKKMLPFMLMSGLGEIRQSEAMAQPTDFSGVASIMGMAQQKKKERLKKATTKKAEWEDIDPTSQAAQSARTSASIYASKVGLSPRELGLDKLGKRALNDFVKDMELIVEETGKTERKSADIQQQVQQLAREYMMHQQQLEQERDLQEGEQEFEREKLTKEQKAEREKEKREAAQAQREGINEKLDEMRPEYQDTREMERTLDEMSEVLDEQVGTGKLQGSTVGQYLQSIAGIGGNEAIEYLEMLQNQLTLSKTGLMQGPLTDEDLKLLARAGPNMKMDEGQFRRAIKKAKQHIERKKKKYQEARDWARDNKGTWNDFETYWEETAGDADWMDEQTGGQGQQNVPDDYVTMKRPDGATVAVSPDVAEQRQQEGYTLVQPQGPRRDQPSGRGNRGTR